MEQEDWGEHNSTVSNTPTWEIPPPIETLVDNIAPLCELPPLPQREGNKRRNRQRSLLELLVPRSVPTSDAPGGEPLKPAGTAIDSICAPHFDTGGIAIDSTREYSMEDHEPLSSKENTTRDTLPEVVDEGEYCTEYIEGGNTRSMTPSMSRIHEVQYLEKAPATPSSSTDSRLVDNIERMGNMNTRGDMRNMTDGNMKCSFTKNEMCVIHDVRVNLQGQEDCTCSTRYCYRCSESKIRR